jgi:hypothetical protein
MSTNKKMYYVKHRVHPDSSDATTRGVLKGIKEKVYVYIPFKVNHFIFDDDAIRKECGVFVLKEIKNPLSIVPELTLIKGRSKSGFNKLTLTLSKPDEKDKKISIVKRASLIFSRDFYTPELATKIADKKKVKFEKEIDWTIVTITGPTERFKLKVQEPSADSEEDEKDKGTEVSKK